jgi:hypothetical protein
MAGIEFWDLFRITVEGRVSPASCAWENGTPIFCAIPIKKKAKPDLLLLAEMLRSGAPIPVEVRGWLADMVDPNAKSDFQFKKLSKRGRGAKTTGHTANWDAAEFVSNRMAAGDTRQEAIGSALGKFHIEKAAIEEALRSMKEAKAVHDAIEQGYLARPPQNN